MKTKMEINEERVSDFMHTINNFAQEVASMKEHIGVKNRELTKLRFAKKVFCTSIFLGLLSMMYSSYEAFRSDYSAELGYVFVIRVLLLGIVLVAGWWGFGRAIQKEKILIGYNISEG